MLLSHGVKRSGGGWEGVVSNSGALSEALVRPESCSKSGSGRASNQQLIVGHRLVQGHPEATIVVTASCRHSCRWRAPPTFARLPLPLPAKTPLGRRG